MLPQGNFDDPITLSLFDLFKLFDLLLLTCDIMAVHLLLLDLEKTFLTCLLLDDVYPIPIYFYIVK